MSSLVVVLSVAMVLACGGVAGATTLHFDDLAPGLITSYGGLTWWLGFPLPWYVVDAPGPLGHSAPNAAWSPGYTSIVAASGVPFAVNDAWLATDDPGFEVLRIAGMDAGGAVVGEAAITDLGAAAKLYALPWAGVVYVVFYSPATTTTSGLASFVMDDLRINEGAPVPEPATVLLLATGALGLAAFAGRARSNRPAPRS